MQMMLSVAFYLKRKRLNQKNEAPIVIILCHNHPLWQLTAQ
jgi:hypothetical protein